MSNGKNSNVVPMKALLEAGVHFGHRTRRWNPKMKPYIFTERNGIHIIDLQQTIARLNQAYEVVKETVIQGGTVLFVGTKKQAQETIVQEANRCNMPFVEHRWLGGTLTNWRTIRPRIDHLLDIEKQKARGEFARLIKKEALMREREIERLNRRLRGLKEMRRLPNLMFITDIRRDDLAVKEANILGIPIIAMVDTNCDPDPIDHVIPSNDDAIRAIKLMVSIMADGVIEGRNIYNSMQAEEEEVQTLDSTEAMERYLGPSTLAKLQATEPEGEAEAGAEVAETAAPAPEPEPEPEPTAEAEPETAPTPPAQQTHPLADEPTETIAEEVINRSEGTVAGEENLLEAADEIMLAAEAMLEGSDEKAAEKAEEPQPEPAETDEEEKETETT